MTATDIFRKALRDVQARTVRQCAETAAVEIDRAEERGRNSVLVAFGETFLKALPSLIGGGRRLPVAPEIVQPDAVGALLKSFDESKVKRDHGKFSSKPVAGGGGEAVEKVRKNLSPFAASDDYPYRPGDIRDYLETNPIDSVPVADIPVGKLIGQSDVNGKYVLALVDGAEPARSADLPIVVQDGDRYWIDNGTNRAAAEAVKGAASIRARLFVYDPMTGETAPADAAQPDPIAAMVKSLAPETPAERLHTIAAQAGYADTLRHLKAVEPWEYADLLALCEDEWSLERVTKADRSHLVRTIITNRLGHRQVVWRKKQDGEEPRGASRGQEGDDSAKPAPLTREQVAESRTIVANAVADPNNLNPEQIRDLAKHINAVTKEEAKGLLRVLGAKVSGRQMEVAQRLLDTIRAGRERGKGVGDALERAGNKVTGQYGAWGVAAGGTGGKPEAKRDEFPKRGVGPGENTPQVETPAPQTDAQAPQPDKPTRQPDKPTRQPDKPDFAAMTADEVDAHMSGLKGKDYGDALRDMPSDVAKVYLERKTAADRFARRSRAGGKAAVTRARRAGELDAKLSTETGKRLHEAEQNVKRLGERYKVGGNVTDAMFDRAQRELENASLAHNLYTTHQNPDVVAQRRNDELPDLDLTKGPDPTEATRDMNTIPWTARLMDGEPPVVISGAKIETTRNGQRVVRLYGIDPGQMAGDSQTGVRGNELGSLLVHFDAGDPDESRRARRLIHQIAHGKAQDMTIEEMRSLITGKDGERQPEPAPLTPAEFDRRMSQLDPRDSGNAPQPEKPRPLTPDDADIEKRRAAGEKLGRMEDWQAERPSVAADEAVGRARERVRAAGGGEVLGDEEEVRAATAGPVAPKPVQSMTPREQDAELAALNRTPYRQLTGEQKRRRDELSRAYSARKNPDATPVMTGGGKGPGGNGESENEGTAFARQNWQTVRRQAAEGMAAGAAAMQQPHDGSGLPDQPMYASLSPEQRAELDAQHRAAKTKQDARGVQLRASRMAGDAESARRSDAARAASAPAQSPTAGVDNPTVVGNTTPVQPQSAGAKTGGGAMTTASGHEIVPTKTGEFRVQFGSDFAAFNRFGKLVNSSQYFTPPADAVKEIGDHLAAANGGGSATPPPAATPDGKPDNYGQTHTARFKVKSTNSREFAKITAKLRAAGAEFDDESREWRIPAGEAHKIAGTISGLSRLMDMNHGDLGYHDWQQGGGVA